MRLKNDKQEKFAYARAILEKNKKDSAIYAGYSKKGAHTRGYQLNKQKRIIDRIQELREEQVKELGIDNLFLLKGILETLKDRKCPANAKLNAYFELADRLGLLKEDSIKEKEEQLEDITDKEIEERIKELSEK